MKRLQKFDNIAIGFMGVLGAVFFVMGAQALSNVSVSCPSFAIRNGWTSILTMGACMTMGSIAYFVCTFGAGSNCYSTESTRTVEVHLSIYLILSLLMIAVCSSMLALYKKVDDKDKSKCDNGDESNHKLMIIIIVMSVFIITACGFLLYNINYGV